MTGSSDPLEPLRRFQDTGDPRALAEHVSRLGLDTERYAAALRILTPVFDALGHGEYPAVDELDRRRLLEYEPEMRFIAHCMGDSDMADLGAVAARLRHLLERRH